jgi:hypothetical protein
VSPLINEGSDLVLRVGAPSGQKLVQSDSPLTRLNYFDGKFLRADDLRREQDYVRQLVQFSNQGLGAGIVYGLDATLAGEQLTIGPGLAMDSAGRTLLVSAAATLRVGTLIEATRRLADRKQAARAAPRLAARETGAAPAEFAPCVDVTAPPGDDLTAAAGLYVICIGHAESLCGTEDVYGRLCEEACITATDRPYLVEGVMVRALPLTLRTAYATSRAITLTRQHLRSLVASAFFEDERHVVESLVSGAGLGLDTWCLGAEPAAVGCVPLAVIARAGTTTVYLDAWTVRRERIEAPARRYWAWRMRMRPWDAYLAQILQFQCQLHEILKQVRVPGTPDDPCASHQEVLSDTAAFLQEVKQSYLSQVETLKLAPANAAFTLPSGSAGLVALQSRIDRALRAIGGGVQERVLINGGIVELPSAGYLPVVPGVVTVNRQVQRLLGEGVDLRFCLVRPDYVAHALEEAQHMERISLLQGLDDPAARPEVDILVPNGLMETVTRPELGGWDSTLALNAGQRVTGDAAGQSPITLHGSGRSETLPGGGAAFHFAGAQEVDDPERFIRFVRDVATLNVATLEEREKVLRRMPIGEVTGSAAGARIATSTVSRIGLLRTGGGAAAHEAAPPVAAGWVTMQIQADPFGMQVAETTPVSLEILLTMVRKDRPLFFRSQVNGTLRLTQGPVPSADSRSVRGQITGLTRLSATAGDTQVTNPFTADVEVTQAGDAATGSVKVQLVGSERRRFGYQLEASWDGSPTTARLSLTGALMREGVVEAIAGSAPQPLATARLTRSATALELGGELRTLSTTAIEALGRELGDPEGPGFADAAGRTLFPPPPPPSQELTVRGTLDWVLFHRRRTKQCAVAVEPPPAPRNPKYQVYHYLLKEEAELDAVRKALQTKEGITRFQYDQVAVAEYAATQAALLSDIQSDWKTVDPAPGNSLAYGAIATAGEEDAPSLEQARLSRLASTLAPTTRTDPSTVLEALPDVPDALQWPGTSGIVFLVTRAVVREECQRVFGVPNRDMWQRIRSFITRTTPGEATAKFIDESLKPFMGQFVFPLGRVVFDAETGAVRDQNQLAKLAQAWSGVSALKGRGLGLRAVWGPPDDPAANLHEIESSAIEPVIPAAGAPVRDQVPSLVAPKEVALGDDEPAARCPVVTFLVGAELVETTVRAAWVIAAPREGEAHIVRDDALATRVKFIDDEPDGDSLRQFIGKVVQTQHVGGVTLAVVTPPIDAGADARLRIVVAELSAAGQPPQRSVTATLNARDRKMLTDTHPVDGMDEVIFLER